jgi:threonine dehydratase
MDTLEQVIKRVFNARVGELLPEATPLDSAEQLSARFGRPVLLKREDLTPVFSFKLRGAYNQIVALADAELQRGVIAASAGNHAQGVAISCQRLGCPARIVMPQTTPAIKVEAVRRFGAQIDLYGDSYSDAARHCQQLIEQTGMTYCPPFDHPDVIAGQGTVALELLRQAPRGLGSVFVPIGGGGLAAGIASVIKALRPGIQVVGVEPADSDAMRRSLERGARVVLEHVGIFADGVAVRQVGELTFAMCRQYLDDCITVDTDEICAAIEDAFVDTRSILEPAGALSIAGLKRQAETKGLPAGAAVAIASGANMAFSRLGYVSERAEVGRHREAIFAATIPERPGSFLQFCLALGPRSVTEFNYRLGSRERANVFLGVEVSGLGEAAAIAQALRQHGYGCVDLTQDDLAKTHVRHMVGGLAEHAQDEVLYQFEFPERPGALAEFLTSLSGRWNISLFHYRNHGAAWGRVLCGMEVPPPERAQLEATLDAIGFSYRPVADSPATVFLLGAR